MNYQLANVILLGAAFHLIFFAFQTSVFIQQTVVNSIRSRPGNQFAGSGYVSLCITYSVFAVSNWLAPSIIALTGARYGMFLGATTYCLYAASFLYPTTLLFYLAAALIGLGAGPLWSAQGSYLTRNSDAHTSSRNAAIFWSMLQSSILFGNIFVYLAFQNQPQISDATRWLVYGVLAAVCSLGTLLLLFLREGEGECEGAASPPAAPSALGQLVGALRLARSGDMALLALAFLFTGQLLSFFTGVYGTAIGATGQFGPDSKKFIGLAGISIGAGEILGGSLFGLLGARLSKRLGRDTIFLLGYLATLAALALTFVNLPPDSPLADRAARPPILRPRLWIAMVGSVLIGLGDACFNTQIYALLMSVYSGNSVAAFALFKFVQSLGSAAAFLYSTRLDLYWQIALLAGVATLATICFCLVEWRFRSRAPGIEKSESHQNIVRHDDDDDASRRNYRTITANGYCKGQQQQQQRQASARTSTVVGINR